jgi:DNA-binding NarL/FixJ family response regulator
MTQPLALLLYEKLLPGTQLVNRLQDIGWRVQTLHDPAGLTRAAEEHKPILVLADLSATNASVYDGIGHLRRNQSTSHVPVIAFGADESTHKPALEAGATLVVSDTAVLQHLNQFIDQALSEF